MIMRREEKLDGKHAQSNTRVLKFKMLVNYKFTNLVGDCTD